MYPIRREECEQLAEELDVEIESKRPEPGEFYIAGRNTGPKLLTCAEVDEDLGCIHAEEDAYSFDLHECYRLKDEYQ
jgi:hypothetical protein